MSIEITSLLDYPSLKKLAAALWQQDNAYHGAAIMVGAGFSRSAAITEDINNKLPLWNDLSKILAEELGVYGNADPLRLAEEYSAYFGKQALHDLVKKEINDAAWSPGELYKPLLELPWTEVLTTNWDTLLERASSEVHQPVYNVVSKQEDLSSARPPRIVKLHGTINVTEDLVFTQEDYRKYPQHHAAFVNFARQVFLENELCLLGFSGDDPNFLQWAGWVRDHLATHVRRIYLVGALRLTAAKRKYLESINVAPIDLNDLVSDYDDRDARHFEATKIFIQTLQGLKPKQLWEWSPTQLSRTNLSAEEFERKHNDYSHAARLLEQQISTLEADRASYPGWLVCPNRQRWELQNQIRDPFPTAKNMAEMEPGSRAKILYEIAWQQGMTYEAVPLWLAKELLSVCDPTKPCVLTKRQQLEVALLMLKNTRWFDGDEFNSVEQAASQILENNAKHWPEISNEAAYHYALMARDEFDYPSLEKFVDRITDIGSVWKLRKASLLAELGQFEKGGELVAQAYRELLGQYRKYRNSVYIISRLVWAHWLLRRVNLLIPGKECMAFPSNYQDPTCSPSDYINDVQNRISKALDKQREQQTIEPLFEPGHYKDNSNTVTFNNELHPLLLLEGISSTVGIPLRWNHVNLLAESAAKLAELDELDSLHRFALAIRAANSDTSDVLNKVFSRNRIASLSHEEAGYLLNHCRQAVDYWRSKCSSEAGKSQIYAIERLRIFIEVLARVSVRARPEQAKQIFRSATAFGKMADIHHFWLFDALRHLVEFCLKSIPELQHNELLLEALSFPLQIEIGVNNYKEWPNPVINNPGNRSQDAALDRRIDEIIDKMGPCSTQSAPALLRLMPLFEKGFLTDAECRKLARKIWGDAPDYQDLPETGLLKCELLKLPSQDPSAVRKRVRDYLFEEKSDRLIAPSFLMDIVNAAQAESVKEFPSSSQAVDYFERLISWRAREADDSSFDLFQSEDSYIAGLIGQALSRSVVPALPAASLTEETFGKLRDFYTETSAAEILMAFPYFSVANAIFTGEVETYIRQGLQSQEGNRVAYSSFALLKWKDMNASQVPDRLISRLIYFIESGRMVGLPALLWTVNQMYEMSYLSDEDSESLKVTLPNLFDSSKYVERSLSCKESISTSLVRAACVRLARDILKKSQVKHSELVRILEEARQDALPEVRFAEIADI